MTVTFKAIAEKGRMGWQKASGYNTCSRVDAAIGRYEQVIGEDLRSCKDERRASEVAVAVQVLNRMRELARPIPVRIGTMQICGVCSGSGRS